MMSKLMQVCKLQLPTKIEILVLAVFVDCVEVDSDLLGAAPVIAEGVMTVRRIVATRQDITDAPSFISQRARQPLNERIEAFACCGNQFVFCLN